jgi:hypothetical protein
MATKLKGKVGVVLQSYYDESQRKQQHLEVYVINKYTGEAIQLPYLNVGFLAGLNPTAYIDSSVKVK